MLVGTDINSWKQLVRVCRAGMKSQFFCLKRACVVLPQAQYHSPPHTLRCHVERATDVLTQFSFVLHFMNSGCRSADTEDETLIMFNAEMKKKSNFLLERCSDAVLDLFAPRKHSMSPKPTRFKHHVAHRCF